MSTETTNPENVIVYTEPAPQESPKTESAYIYKITNTINGKLYIGETTKKDPTKRWKGHLYTIRKGMGCPLLQSAVLKYGEENFTFEVIKECPKHERFELEIKTIDEYNSLVPNGYNATKGGMGGGFKGKKHSQETKQKMAKATAELYAAMSDEKKNEFRQKLRNRTYKGGVCNHAYNEDFRLKMRNLNLGKKLSEETKAKISNSLKCMSHTLKEETRKKISESVKRTYENGRDRTFTEERKANLSKAIIEKRGVKIAQYNMDCTFVRNYNSIKEASDELKLSTIHKAVSGKGKSAGGFLWKRIETES